MEREKEKERESQVEIKSAIELPLIPLGVVLRFRLVLRLSLAAEVCSLYPPPSLSLGAQTIYMHEVHSELLPRPVAPLAQCPL